MIHLLWHALLMAQWPQLQPQDEIPGFFLFLKLITIRDTITIKMKETKTVPPFALNQFIIS